jgi:signal transduction histidine kinase
LDDSVSTCAGARLVVLLTPMNRGFAQFLGLSVLLWAAHAAGQVGITAVRVDGRDLPVPSAGTPTVSNRQAALQIPPGAALVQFNLQSGEWSAGEPWRLRFKLEGFDADWRNLSSSMRFVLRFLDDQNLIIAAQEVLLANDSAGWKRNLQTSQFTPALLEAVAPPRAAKVQPWAVSGGPEVTVGTFAFRNVRVRTQSGTNAPSQLVTHSIELGRDLDQPLGSLEDWRRDGSRPQMAQVLRLDSPQPHHVLALMDSDPRRFAAWLVPPHRCAAVQPGEVVVLEWEQCHAIGSAGPAPITYERLPPGYYWLRVAAVGLDGNPVGPEASLAVVVLAPVWQRLWFWLITVATGSLLTVLAVRRAITRRMQRALDQAERRHALERERTRIARDIHDDLGTTLTQISMLSETALGNPSNPPQTAVELSRICDATREATRAMDEIVWAADPENDSLDELATYISGFTQELLNGVGVRCRLALPASFPRVVLSAEVRHNVFLAFKEALNNALKHGQPTEVRVSMNLEEGRFVLVLEDDGKGFATPAAVGHGLHNMQQRLERLQGRFQVESQTGKGTRVRLEVPVQAELPDPRN